MSAVPQSRPWLFAVAALAAMIAGLIAARYFTRAPTLPPPAIGGYVLPQPQALPPVELVDDKANRFTPADFAGHWSFLYFGYTYCPDVCPLALIELASVKKLLAAEPANAPAEYYLVSVDPARDTPERLREYVTYFDPSFHGLTGAQDDLRNLAETTGSVFFIPEGQGADNYLVSHSSNVVVLDPAGRLFAVITPPHEPSGIAADFAKIVAYRATQP
jgi:protein SCO1/2